MNNMNIGLDPIISRQLQELETLAQQHYEGVDPRLRNESMTLFTSFSSSAESIGQCRLILDYSKNQYALLLGNTYFIHIYMTFYTTYSTIAPSFYLHVLCIFVFYLNFVMLSFLPVYCSVFSSII